MEEKTLSLLKELLEKDKDFLFYLLDLGINNLSKALHDEFNERVEHSIDILNNAYDEMRRLLVDSSAGGSFEFLMERYHTLRKILEGLKSSITEMISIIEDTRTELENKKKSLDLLADLLNKLSKIKGGEI